MLLLNNNAKHYDKIFKLSCKTLAVNAVRHHPKPVHKKCAGQPSSFYKPGLIYRYSICLIKKHSPLYLKLK